MSILKNFRHLCSLLVRRCRLIANFLTLLYLNAKGCRIASTARVHHTAQFELSGGKIEIGERCFIDRGVIVRAMGGDIIIGPDTYINAYTFLSGAGGLRIGRHVMVGSHVSMYASNHVISRIDVPMDSQGLIALGIVIDNDVWIGTGARILDGITIGAGSVIAAGAVVTKSTMRYSVNAGVPSTLIRRREAAVGRVDFDSEK